MRKIFISLVFSLFISFTYATAEVERYKCFEVKTVLVNDKIDYSIKKDNYTEFEIKDCLPENLKIHTRKRSIIYKQFRRIVEDGRIEKNDLFAIECNQPFPEDGDLTYYEGIRLNFYRGKISPLINPEYPLYPTIKQTAEKLNLETPDRTFVVFNGFGGSSHEFFCYMEQPSVKKPIRDPCQYSFDEVLEIHAKDKNTVALEDLAEKYLKKHDYEKAEKAYKKVLEISDGKDPTDLINFYFATKQYSKAKEILLKEIKSSPFDPLPYISLASIYLFEGKLEKAKSFIKKALNLRFERELYKAYEILGEVYIAERNYKDAVISFKKALESFKEECRITSIMMGKFLNNRDISPGDYCENSGIPFQLKIIQALIELEKFTSAEKLARDVLNRDERNLVIYGHLSYLYAGMGQFDKALQMADRAISLLKRKNIGASIVEGEIYPQIVSVYKNSPAERAGLKNGDKIINIDDKDLRLFREKGNLLDMLVEYIEGNDKVRFKIHSENSTELRDVELIPEESLEHSASQFLSMKALILRVKGDYREFEALSSKAYELNPEDRLTLIVSALAMADKNRYSDAFEILKKLEKLERGGSSSLTLLISIIIYAKSGQMEKAGELYKKIPQDLLKTKNSLYKAFLNDIKSIVRTVLKVSKTNKEV
jgi:tetratricopeptide (TPR) repeat protein